MENLQGQETANRRPRRFNAKGRRNGLEVGVGALVSRADSFSTRKTPGGLRPRRSVVVGSLTLLVSGLVITATAIPVSANPGTTRLVSRATSISTARTSTAAPRVAPSGALVSYSPASTKSGVRRATRSTSRHRRNQQNVAPTTTTTAVNSFSPIPTTKLGPTTTTSVAPTTTTSLAPTTTTALAPTTTTALAPTTTTTSPPAVVASAFPTGVADNSEPSGYAPPGSNAFAGYTQIYTSDFSGSSLPAGWGAYSGTPGGDPGGQFGGNAHVAVGGGLLQLNTFLDPAYNNEWVTGGLCQCGLSQTYGAYFVRSRVTGAGPTGVELLWPVANVWPPEIDFNETNGSMSATTATNIWAASSTTRSQVQVKLSVNMTQWHTWGVIWTPTSITYTMDGQVWGTFTNASQIPNQPMTLDLQQQTWCSSGWACPTSPQSMQVDWVTEYRPS
jgi:hypothetical protein